MRLSGFIEANSMLALAKRIKEVILRHRNKPLTKELAKVIAKELIRDVGIGIEGGHGTRDPLLIHKQLVESLLRVNLLQEYIDNPVITELVANERGNNLAAGWEELGYK